MESDLWHSEYTGYFIVIKSNKMEKNNQNQLGNLTITFGALLFVSSFWVEDKKTAVNRRWAGMLLAGAGLYIKPLK